MLSASECQGPPLPRGSGARSSRLTAFLLRFSVGDGVCSHQRPKGSLLSSGCSSESWKREGRDVRREDSHRPGNSRRLKTAFGHWSEAFVVHPHVIEGLVGAADGSGHVTELCTSGEAWGRCRVDRDSQHMGWQISCLSGEHKRIGPVSALASPPRIGNTLQAACNFCRQGEGAPAKGCPQLSSGIATSRKQQARLGPRAEYPCL